MAPSANVDGERRCRCARSWSSAYVLADGDRRRGRRRRASPPVTSRSSSGRQRGRVGRRRRRLVLPSMRRPWRCASADGRGDLGQRRRSPAATSGLMPAPLKSSGDDDQVAAEVRRSTVSSIDALIDAPNVVNRATTAVPTISADALPAVRRGLRIALRRARRPVRPRSDAGADAEHGGRGPGDDRAEDHGADEHEPARRARPGPGRRRPTRGGDDDRDADAGDRATPSDGPDASTAPDAVDGRRRAARRAGRPARPGAPGRCWRAASSADADDGRRSTIVPVPIDEPVEPAGRGRRRPSAP